MDISYLYQRLRFLILIGKKKLDSKYNLELKPVEFIVFLIYKVYNFLE